MEKKKKSDFGKLFEPKAFQHISLQSKLNQPIADKNDFSFNLLHISYEDSH